ncbi:MAG: DUF4145 domain-containing protein [Thermoguttaceae bacterium]
MNGATPKLSKDREAITLKFGELIEKAKAACEEFNQSKDGTIRGNTYFELRVSAINLLSRLSGDESIYVHELKEMKPNAFSILGVLEAARTDYLQGFLADHKLLLSAEVFSDLIVQAEVLLDHDYKDAAAVLIRAVLEDAIRRLCEANKIEAGKRDTLQQLNEKLYTNKVYNAVQHKEVIATAEIGNSAAHGRFDQYKKEDVKAFLEFVLRFMSQYLR